MSQFLDLTYFFYMHTYNTITQFKTKIAKSLNPPPRKIEQLFVRYTLKICICFSNIAFV